MVAKGKRKLVEDEWTWECNSCGTTDMPFYISGPIIRRYRILKGKNPDTLILSHYPEEVVKESEYRAILRCSKCKVEIEFDYNEHGNLSIRR